MSKGYFCKEHKPLNLKIYDRYGEKIFAEDVDWVHGDEFRTIEVHLKKSLCDELFKLSWDELNLLMYLIEDKIKIGTDIISVRDYLELYDKLKKIRERICSK